MNVNSISTFGANAPGNGLNLQNSCLLGVWQQNDREIALYYSEKQKRFNAVVWKEGEVPENVYELTNCYKTIIGIPEQLKLKSENEKKLFFSETYPKVTSFGNGYKLSIHQRGLGGGLSLEDTIKFDDDKMARVIHEQLPGKTFTTVLVRTETYKFQNGLKGVPVKAIIFGLDNYDNFFKGVKAAFAGMGMIDPKQYDKINESLLKDQVLSCAMNTKSNFSEFEKAASQCNSCVVYVATDLSNAELTSLKNDKIIAIFRLSGVIKYLIEIGISLMKQLKDSKA